MIELVILLLIVIVVLLFVIANNLTQGKVWSVTKSVVTFVLVLGLAVVISKAVGEVAPSSTDNLWRKALRRRTTCCLVAQHLGLGSRQAGLPGISGRLCGSAATKTKGFTNKLKCVIYITVWQSPVTRSRPLAP
jgi:hypothetical protein